MNTKEFRDLIRRDLNIPDNYTLLYTLDFLDILEDSYKDFEAYVDDDGDINLDWISSKESYLSISINYKGELIYACSGELKTCGRTSFKDRIPSEVINLIKYYSKGNK